MQRLYQALWRQLAHLNIWLLVSLALNGVAGISGNVCVPAYAASNQTDTKRGWWH